MEAGHRMATAEVFKAAMKKCLHEAAASWKAILRLRKPKRSTRRFVRALIQIESAIIGERSANQLDLNQ
jgi:hypothetical protein